MRGGFQTAIPHDDSKALPSEQRAKLGKLLAERDHIDAEIERITRPWKHAEHGGES